jgi:PAS domain S-box-containing protein
VPDSLIDLAGLRVGAEDFLATVLGAAAQPIWVVDRHDVIRFANPAAIAALGYDRADDLVGRRSHETIHHSHPDGTRYPAAECPMLLPRATGETISSDLDWFFRRDGAVFPVSYVSAPLEMEDGRGAVVAFTDIEHRVDAERELRERDAILAAQLSSLRRVASLVAGGAGSADVLAAITMEVGAVIGLPMVALWRYEPDGTAMVIGEWSEHPHPFRVGTRWPLDGPTVCAMVLESGRPERIEDFSSIPGAIAGAARTTGIGSCAGAPIIVDGQVWGAMSADSFDRAPLPEGIEDRLAEFTELVATAISNTASREALVRLADEQAALRRVATLVARGVPAAELFEALAREVGMLVSGDATHIGRYDAGGTASLIASWSASGDQMPVGTVAPIDGDNVCSLLLRTGQPARMNSYEGAAGPIATMLRELGLRSSVGAPIVVEGRRWGVAIVSSKDHEPLPPYTEARIAAFTELAGTAVANAQARAEVRRLVDEQAALRRVATLVARESPPEEVFAAVAAEVGRVLSVAGTAMYRYDDDGTATVVASWGKPASDPSSGSEVRCPIVVEGRPWGTMVASQGAAEPLPAETDTRIGRFTELVATAISNVQARSDLAASRARIVAATDDERRRVVRDLHDGAQQRLVHTIVTLKLAEEALRADRETAPKLVGEALDHAQQAIAEIRELSHGILPTVLTRGGLRAAIASLASRTPVPVEVQMSVDRLPAPVEATVYFVVAEALTNVAKHARATAVTVLARIDDATLRVEVHDDGVGGARPDGSGLVGLADRLAALDGDLRVESPADGGTVVAAQVPVEGRDGH